MEENTTCQDRPPTPYEEALAEERLRWWAISRPDSRPTDRLMSYVRWRVAANRLQELLLVAHSGKHLNS